MAEKPITLGVETLQQQAVFEILLEALTPEEQEQVWALYKQKIPPDQRFSMIDFAAHLSTNLPHITLDSSVRLALLKASRVSLDPVDGMSLSVPPMPQDDEAMAEERCDESSSEPFWKRYTSLNI